MYDLITPMPLVNPCDSKGMITDEYIDFLKGSQIQTTGKTLEFEIHSLKQKIYFKVSNNLDQSYTIVGPSHFKNIETEEVIILDIHKPNLSIDMNKFQKATQVDLDSYQSNLNKNNDNCKLYKLIHNIIQMNDSDEDDGEDPYYRGNINDIIKN